MPAGSWLVSLTQAPNSYTSLATNNTVRVVLKSALLSYTGLVYARVTFQSQDATNGLTVSKAYIGAAASAGSYAFAATPRQLLFSAAANFAIGVNTTQVSDGVAFSIPASTDIVISFHISALSGFGGKSGLASGNRLYYKAGDDAATVSASGYTASTDGTIWPIIKIETAPEAGGIMGFF